MHRLLSLLAASRGWLATAGAALLVSAASTPSASPVAQAPPPSEAKPARAGHPRLVSVEAARCAMCHEKLSAGKVVVHPATEDCTACHEVVVAQTGTVITLKEQGPGLCLACHDDLAAAAQGKLKAPHAPVTDSCTNCHDPHASAQPHLLSAPVGELCRSCHEASGLQTSHAGQITESSSCLACHAPHGSALPRLLKGAHQHPPFAEKSCEACHRQPFAGRMRLQARNEQLCTACHGDMGAAAKQGGSVHPALRATGGRIACLACHTPHLSANAKLLVREGPSLCAGCHKAVVSAATAKGGHAPAAEDCLACHAPHAAPRHRLLNEDTPALCLGCHDATDAALKKAHLGADLAKLTCTSCHSPHGEGQPKLLARHVHPPVLEGCGTCHEGAFDKQIENGQSALCLACHEDVGTLAQKAKVPHAAMEAGRCVDCHNPHASPRERLIKAPGGGPCLECHEDKRAAPGESLHGAIDLVGCRACHEPHGGDNPRLLRVQGNQLCLDCHGARPALGPEADGPARLAGRFDIPAAAARAVSILPLSTDSRRGHPIPGHPVAGTPNPKARGKVNFSGELSCLACHDPHKARSPRLLRWEVATTMEACLKCHPK